MAIITSPLSATEVHKAKPAAKPYYLFDGRGLCLQIKPNGNKFWRCRYTRPVTKKPTEISLGQYLAVSLADARKEHQKLLALLAKGIDPRDLEQEAENQVKKMMKRVSVLWLRNGTTLKKEASLKNTQNKSGRHWKKMCFRPLAIFLLCT